jgi:hypothetical protein
MDKRCNKCDVLKPSTDYYTYYHSTQKKHRTRNICNSCMYLQKKKYIQSIKEEKIIQPDPVKIVFTPTPTVNPLSTNPDFRLCRTCQEYVHYDGYYKHKSKSRLAYLDCRKCCNRIELDKRKKERQEHLENNGGSERVGKKVGMWQDKYQKEQTYEVMEALGYKYDEVSGHFLKPGVKEWINGKLFFPMIGKKKYMHIKRIDYTNDIWDKVYQDYLTGNYTFKYLSDKYDFSDTTICNYVKKRKLY